MLATRDPIYLPTGADEMGGRSQHYSAELANAWQAAEDARAALTYLEATAYALQQTTELSQAVDELRDRPRAPH